MGRSFIRQDAQIQSSSLYDDTLVYGIGLEVTAGSGTLEHDLNALRSQVKRILGTTHWYDGLAANSRSLGTIDTELNDLETSTFLHRSQIFTDIPISLSNNWVVLAVSASEAPSLNAAVGAVVTTGSVAASGSIGSHSLEIVSGSHALRPKNLVLIRSSSSGEVIQTSGSKDIYGLLVTEAPDGGTYDDSTQRVQITFVMENFERNAFQEVPVADIGGKVINYSYARRTQFQDLDEESFMPGVFVDIPAATGGGSVEDLNDVIDNQGTTPATQETDIFIRMDDEVAWNFQDSTGGSTIFAVTASALAGGDAVILNTAITEFNTTDLDVNNTNTADFSQGVSVDTTDQALNIGVTAGQIDTNGVLTLWSQGDNDLVLSSSKDIVFHDANKDGSTFATDLLLASESVHWDNIDTIFGEVSLLEMVYDTYIFASSSALPRDKCVQIVTASIIAADENVRPNIQTVGTACDYSGKDFVNDVNVYLNGQLLWNGADASANNDVYPGDDRTQGDLKFEFILRQNDVITMDIR